MDKIVERKLLVRVGILLFALYACFALDRGNMGFAALEMNGDVGISQSLFGLGASLFTLGYLLCQVPAVTLMRRLGANRGMALVAIAWGLVSTSSALVWDGASFLGFRLALGMAEAGFHAFLVFYISQMFPRGIQGFAVGLALAAVPLAQIVASPLSGVLLDLGAGGLRGWQWLFILEGIPSVMIGLLCLRLIPNTPDDARFLSREELAWLKADLAAGVARAEGEGSLRNAGQIIASPRVWALGFVLFANILGVNTLLFWMPQIIKQLSGAGNLETGLLGAIPWITFAAGMLLMSLLSDRLPNRVPVLCVALCIGGLGFALSALGGSLIWSFVGLLIGAFGIGASQGLFWGVAMQKVIGPAAAAAYAVITMIGNGSGMFANPLIGLAREVTGSFSGVVMALGVFMLLAIGVLLIMDRLSRPNAAAAAAGT